jgi:tetratricopeptide (TPR) repeat protein
MRNFHLQKQEARSLNTRNQIDTKFQDGGAFAPWESYKAAHLSWTEQVADRIKKHGDKLAALEKDLQENPDPKLLYDLAEAHDILRNALDARGLYAALLTEYPEYEKSKSGDTLLRLAEVTYQLRDVGEAEKLYIRMKTEFATHPKVVQANAFDSVDARLKSCNYLKNNMGPSK